MNDMRAEKGGRIENVSQNKYVINMPSFDGGVKWVCGTIVIVAILLGGIFYLCRFPVSRGKTGNMPQTALSLTDVVCVSAKGKRYHRKECKYANAASREEMTKSEAKKRGLTPCAVCKP